jgi:hypothetical protein
VNDSADQSYQAVCDVVLCYSHCCISWLFQVTCEAELSEAFTSECERASALLVEGSLAEVLKLKQPVAS